MNSDEIEHLKLAFRVRPIIFINQYTGKAQMATQARTRQNRRGKVNATEVAPARTENVTKVTPMQELLLIAHELKRGMGIALKPVTMKKPNSTEYGNCTITREFSDFASKNGEFHVTDTALGAGVGRCSRYAEATKLARQHQEQALLVKAVGKEEAIEILRNR